MAEGSNPNNDPYPPGSVVPSIVHGREIYITESTWRELWNYKERLRAALRQIEKPSVTGLVRSTGDLEYIAREALRGVDETKGGT